MSKGYTAFVIDKDSRQLLLERFPPKYANVVAHHITHKFGTRSEDALPPKPQSVKVVGYHDSGAIQVLVVELDGRKHQDSQQGEFYHITLALDPTQGVAPKDSNGVLKAIASRKGEAALCNLKEPLEISVEPRFIAFQPAPVPAVKKAKPYHP